MSNTAINIRFLWWFFQVTFQGEVRFSTSKYWHSRKGEAILKPLGIRDFRPWEIKKVNS